MRTAPHGLVPVTVTDTVPPSVMVRGETATLVAEPCAHAAGIGVSSRQHPMRAIDRLVIPGLQAAIVPPEAHPSATQSISTYQRPKDRTSPPSAFRIASARSSFEH